MSVQMSLDDTIIEESADFLDSIYSKTLICKKTLIRLFHNHHLSISLFRENIRNILECRKVADKNLWNMFFTDCFA